MRPAALTDLVRGIYVQPLAGTQPLHQLAAQLGVAGVLVVCGIHLAQSLSGSANDELVEAHALATATKRVQRLSNGRCLGDRMAGVTGGHRTSVAPRYST